MLQQKSKIVPVYMSIPSISAKDEKVLDKLKNVLGKKPTEDAKDEPMFIERNEFDADFAALGQEDPFLASISMSISKICDPKVPTACIGVVPSKRGAEVVMSIGPKFFRTLNQRQRIGVQKHELYHYIFGHLGSRAIGDTKYSKLHNYATDLAINSIIGENNLPVVCLIPGKRPLMKDNDKNSPTFGQYLPDTSPYGDYIANAPVMQSTEHYFENLRRIYEENGGESQGDIIIGDGTLDDHSGWGSIPKEVEDELRDKLRDRLEKAVKDAERSQRWGSVPSEIQDMLKRMVSNEVNWKSVIRNFFGRCRTAERNSTIRKINKKMPYIYPGVKRPMRAKFAAFIDQSGSMSDEDIELLFGELENLANDVTLDVWFFDTEIDHNSHMVWKRGSTKPRKRMRCGGTDFNAVAQFCNSRENRNKWSGVIILTDGYAPKMGVIRGARVIQVITEHGTMDSVRSGDLAVQMKRERNFRRF
jgi:predicted metal-dependent peptidase